MKKLYLTAYLTKKDKCLHSKVKNKRRMSVFTTYTKHCTGVPAKVIRQKKVEDTQIEKEHIKLSLCADNMIIYIKK